MPFAGYQAIVRLEPIQEEFEAGSRRRVGQLLTDRAEIRILKIESAEQHLVAELNPNLQGAIVYNTDFVVSRSGPRCISLS